MTGDVINIKLNTRMISGVHIEPINQNHFSSVILFWIYNNSPWFTDNSTTIICTCTSDTPNLITVLSFCSHVIFMNVYTSVSLTGIMPRYINMHVWLMNVTAYKAFRARPFSGVISATGALPFCTWRYKRIVGSHSSSYKCFVFKGVVAKICAETFIFFYWNSSGKHCSTF